MGLGRYPDGYLHDPRVQKPLDEVFADMDAYTNEISPTSAEDDHALDFSVILQPLHFEGRRVKASCSATASIGGSGCCPA